MSATSASNIIISEDTVSEQEETRKAARMTLKEVQNVVSALKENLHPRKPLSHVPGKDIHNGAAASSAKQQQQQPSEPKRYKMVEQLTKATQTTFEVEQDLTGAQPSSQYWEKLAESRRLALKETLDENAQLHMEVSGLKEELAVAQNVTESLQSLVDTLVEMLNENEAGGKSGSSSGTDAVKVDDSGIAHSLVEDGPDGHDPSL
uniref:Geminin n=1 Tax=Anopheles christyi TaxID=43041 RepID=A0A182JZ42_9DIPT